ncbi:MAG TPA: carboxylesterase family protein, partial [Phenylobacterium sp.]
TVNHRLNVFGYLHLGDLFGPEYDQSGQAGMLDIVMVLEWVRDNIARFGGDPANVTIFGESGGGAKVSMLQAMPPAKGLFHKAIIQSGPGLRATPRAAATETAKKFLEILGVAPGDVGKLASLPTEMVSRATREVPGDAMRTFAPVVDGTALPRDPFYPDAPAQSADVPVLIGTNKDESTLFLVADPRFGEFTEADLERRSKAAAGDKAERLVAALRGAYPDYSPTHLISALQTATGMWLGSIQLAERKAAQKAAPVYMYQLTWETPVSRGRLKCPHALEIPLVFDNVEKARNFVGRGEEPQTLAEQMSEAWLAFARTGDPNTAGLPRWPAYDAERRATMIFDTTSQVVEDPNADVRAILQA